MLENVWPGAVFRCFCRGSRIRVEIVKRKPDLMLVLLAVFGVSMVITLILPISATRSVAAPASPLQAGLLAETEVRFR